MESSKNTNNKRPASALAATGFDNSQNEWYRPPAAGNYMGGTSTSTLAKWRLAGTGPAYSKAGRLVIYNIQSLDDFLASRRRLSTSEDPEAA